MTDDNKQHLSRPPIRQSNRYAAFKDARQEIVPTVPTQEPEPKENRQELFSMNITGVNIIREKAMNDRDSNDTVIDEQFVINIIFKPLNPSLKLRPEETQILLSYMHEILKNLEAEEQLIIEEEKTQ